MNAKPRTIAEAVDQLQQWLNLDQLSTLAAQSEDDLIDDHLGLGAHIRNAFGLWEASSPLLRDCQASEGARGGPLHPDDASVLILHALWRRLHH